MTNQEIKKRFFGTHIGCKIKTPDSIGVLLGFRPNYPLRVYFETTPDTIESTTDDCKLILRPPSAISDEEAWKCCEILGYFKPEYFREFLTRAVVGDEKGFEAETLLKSVKILDYLRSIGICLPFMGLDPVKQGWALLDSNT